MNSDFFNNINGYALDNEQKNAILSSSRYTLVVAGAGAGKTLTMIGKIKYLCEIKKISPQDILYISFTNESTKSLKDKLQGKNIDILTFHKLAIKILNENNYDYELVPEQYLNDTIEDFFLNYCYQNKNIRILFEKTIHKWLPNYKFYLKSLREKTTENFKKTILQFINLYNANNLTKEKLTKLFSYQNKNQIALIYSIICFYEYKKKEEHILDFDDLIKIATKIIKNNGKITNYKEIIIDEFQDTSLLRLQFIKELVEKTNANLTVVGDDFQSIYKFSGCNLNIFLDFASIFPNAKTFKIQTTYRNCQELISTAGAFIMKNNKQLKKELISQKRITNPIIFVKYGIDKRKKLIYLIQNIYNKTHEEILILGRNNFDLFHFLNTNEITWQSNGYFQIKKKPYLLRFLTIHKSKGLESPNVIIINLEKGPLGFPCQKKSPVLIQKLQGKEEYLYAEERRLFYVALTRTKNKCYLLIPNDNPSPFIKEIIKIIKKNKH